MPYTLLLCRLALVTALLFTSFASAQVVQIPKGVEGTYELTYSGSVNTSVPYQVGQKVTFVIDSGELTLCINGSRYFGAHMLTSSNVRFILSGLDYVLVISGGALSEITLYKGSKSQLANPETLYGRFTGARSSTAVSCGTPAGPSLSSGAAAVLDLAADVYPTMFTQGSELRSLSGYVYKYFAGSGIYIGFKDDRIYAMGGTFGPAISELGTVAGITTLLQTTKANQFKAIAPGVQWLFGSAARSDAGSVSISESGFQTGSGKGLSVTLTGGSVVLAPGVRVTLAIASPTASPVVIPKGKYFCSTTAGSGVQIRVLDTNYTANMTSGSDCWVELGEDVAMGRAVVGKFSVVASNSLLGLAPVTVSGSFNVIP